MKNIFISGIILLFAVPSANAFIINLDAKVNGWPDEYNGIDYKGVDLPLTKGLWQSTIINSTISPEALYTAWSYAGPGYWITKYSIEVKNNMFIGGEFFYQSSSPQEAYDATNIKTLQFNLLEDQSVVFRVWDNQLMDNLDGLSLRIERIPGDDAESNAVPEPATVVFFGLGGVGMLLRRLGHQKAWRME